MPAYTLGTLEASEALIRDLYLDLRARVNAWSEVTKQTAQARMGYIGQHLVSAVTGYPGGKSGARGKDLLMGSGSYGEIKTCYRVDQLGKCGDCSAAVSSLETTCPECGSENILRKDDSKWLISFRDEAAFSKALDPLRYYFALSEMEDISNPDNRNIIASIWEVDPMAKGFAYGIMDYYFNIRAKSKSKAAFNVWPYEIKFQLMKPLCIYRAVIGGDGTIQTQVFPTLENTVFPEELPPLTDYCASKTLTVAAAKAVLSQVNPGAKPNRMNKRAVLEQLEQLRQAGAVSNAALCDLFAKQIYLPRILPHKASLPGSFREKFQELT